MTVHLLALCPGDGWALAREGSATWLLRPPYRLVDKEEVPDEQAPGIVSAWGAEVRSESYPDWDRLYSELDRVRVASSTPGERAESVGAAQRLLARSTAEQARRGLPRLVEALSSGHRAGVEAALRALLRSEEVRADAELRSELEQLLASLESPRGDI